MQTLALNCCWTKTKMWLAITIDYWLPLPYLPNIDIFQGGYVLKGSSKYAKYTGKCKNKLCTKYAEKYREKVRLFQNRAIFGHIVSRDPTDKSFQVSSYFGVILGPFQPNRPQSAVFWPFTTIANHYGAILDQFWLPFGHFLPFSSISDDFVMENGL